MKIKFKFIIVRPGGNDTAIVEGFVPKSARKKLNDKIIWQFPNVEQCSFYEMDRVSNIVRFCMMGGEFSGNAMLAITYLLLKGQSVALALTKSRDDKRFIQKFLIQQPSKSVQTVTIEKNKNGFSRTILQNGAEIVNRGEITL